jgi:gamma-glutamyltranspeptidase/glutathione hydrolase
MSSPFLNQALLHQRTRNRSTIAASHGMVCASEPLAAMAGVDILKAGGNCIDAAITTNAMLGLTEPAMNGIGGDLFAIVWIESEQKLLGLNASGRAPYSWNLEEAGKLGLERIPYKSPLSWTVPGCVSGWQALRERFGTLALGDCLAPAIAAAEEGFPLAPIVSQYFDTGRLGDASGISSYSDDSFGPVYNPGNSIPGFGDLFRNPLLAKNYRAISSGGPDAFYRGEIAEGIVSTSKRMGGFMELTDLADHHADWIEPVSSSYRGWDVWALPPNGQGITVLQMLNILECFDISSLQPGSAQHLHLLVEAKRLAFEDRAKFYADPAFTDVPVDWLISKEYAKQRAAKLDPRRAAAGFGPGDPLLGGDTTYLTAADRHGNMISLIQSIYNPWGSTICPDGCGFAMQSRGQAFSLDPGHVNRLEPHKRPFHTIIPGFLTQDGRPVMSFGVMGADFQPQGQSQVLVNMIDFGMSVQQAGDQPRIAHEGGRSPWAHTAGPGEIQPEAGVNVEVLEALAGMGHQISDSRIAHGGYQAIWREDDPLRYFGGSDPRKDGAALGY